MSVAENCLGKFDAVVSGFWVTNPKINSIFSVYLLFLSYLLISLDLDFMKQ